MVVTFYSFKGGVGRSMALANIAELLAGYGYRVIVCDWDLEAPGLERYFVSNNATGPTYQQEMDGFLDVPGLVDLLIDYKDTLAHPQEDPPSVDTHTQVGDVWVRRPSSYTVQVNANRPSPGSLRLLTAGRRSGEHRRRYGDAIRRFDWQQFYDDWAGDAYMDFFRRDLAGEGPKGLEGAADLLLIDSRTGVTEQGGVCTHHLADLVLVLTAANDLNMEGAKWMVHALSDDQLIKSRGGRPLSVLPIASRIEQTAQTKELVDFRRQFVREFESALSKHGTDPEAFAVATEIPYMPYYSYHERVVAREEESERELNYYSKYRAIADAIVDYGVKAQLLRERTAQGITARAADAGPRREPFWSFDDFVTELREQLRLRQTDGVMQLLETLDREVHSRTEPFPEAEADMILQTLTRSRQFAMVQQAAESFIRAGISHSRLRHSYARALVEQGNSTLALSMLQTLVTETVKDTHLNFQVRALVGRIYKQQYVESPEPSSSRSIRNLERAVNEYYGLYLSDPDENLWAGVNVVALAARAQRDQITLNAAPDPHGLAATILQAIQSKEDYALSNYWDLASAAELSLALGKTAAAVSYLVQYASHPSVDNFELTSVRREFTSVWGLDARSEPGAILLQILDAAILKSEGGRITVDAGALPESVLAADVRDAELENTLGHPDQARTLEWLQQGLDQSRAVVRIESAKGELAGTGLLLRGDLLHPAFGPKPLLVTAAHVMSADAGAAGAIHPSTAVVVRTGSSQAPETTCSVREVLFTSSPDALDITIADLEADIPDLPLTKVAATVPSHPSRVVVIGHSGSKRLSLGDGELLESDDSRLRYRCPVDAGSSGSPIFDAEWNLVGFHHASGAQPEHRWAGGSSMLGVARGVGVGAIVRELQSQLGDRDRLQVPTLQRAPARVFISYSHKDERLCNELSAHLKVLERNNLVETWFDQSRGTGESWKQEQLDKADIVILLISSDFLASDYVQSSALMRFIENSQSRKNVLIPVVVRPSDWTRTPLARYQVLPKDGTPVTVWSNRDAAWTSVVQGLKQAIDRLPDAHQSA